MKFFLGTHDVSQKWWDAGIPLFISRRRLEKRKALPRARVGWALDSGGFTELSTYGEWRTSEATYLMEVRRFEQEIGSLLWVAPQDWMCEPFILDKTGLTVAEHQARTVRNYQSLRQHLGDLVIPVLQGFTLDDYLRCWELYHQAGVDLEWCHTVGVGSVCRRQNTPAAGLIVRTLADRLLHVGLHGFGVKITGLESFGDTLASADSLAWSFNARRASPLPGCTHARCANCLRYALRWRTQLLERLEQQRLEVSWSSAVPSSPRRPSWVYSDPSTQRTTSSSTTA